MLGDLKAWFRRKEYYQQGDVQLYPHAIPKGVTLKFKNVVEEGEHTGHAHRLEGTGFNFYAKDGDKYLRIIRTTALSHEEHNKIDIPPGDYKVGKIRQEDPFERKISEIHD